MGCPAYTCMHNVHVYSYIWLQIDNAGITPKQVWHELSMISPSGKSLPEDWRKWRVLEGPNLGLDSQTAESCHQTRRACLTLSVDELGCRSSAPLCVSLLWLLPRRVTGERVSLGWFARHKGPPTSGRRLARGPRRSFFFSPDGRCNRCVWCFLVSSACNLQAILLQQQQ